MNLLFLFLAFLIADIAQGAGKDKLGPLPLVSVNLASGSTTTSAPISIQFFDNIGLQFNAPATPSPGGAGLYLVDVSQDYNPNTNTAGSWTTLSFASQGAVWSTEATAATSGTPAAVFYAATPAATFYREIPMESAAYLRVRYVPAATAAGTAVVWLTGKAL